MSEFTMSITKWVEDHPRESPDFEDVRPSNMEEEGDLSPEDAAAFRRAQAGANIDD